MRGRLARALEDRPEVLDGYLFGSTVTGAAREHSDLDVAVYVDPPALRERSAFGYEAALTTALMAALAQRDLAAFRNVLVHGYLEVDLHVLERVLAGHPGELGEFAASVERWLEQEAGGG